MALPFDQAKAKVRDWVEKHRHVVLYDDEGSALLDVASGKSTQVPWRELKTFEEKVHPETKEKYLVLLFEDGRQIALVDPGGVRSEEHTSELRHLGNSYSVFCLKKKNKQVTGFFAF